MVPSALPLATSRATERHSAANARSRDRLRRRIQIRTHRAVSDELAAAGTRRIVGIVGSGTAASARSAGETVELGG
jgi:hypothetical protein